MLATVWILLGTLKLVLVTRGRISLLNVILVFAVSPMGSGKVHTVAPNSIVVRQRVFDFGIPPEQGALNGVLAS
jgi:hypothetical protein